MVLKYSVVVSPSVTLQMLIPGYEVVGKPLPAPPDAQGEAAQVNGLPLAQFGISAYTITVDWGDGSALDTDPTLYALDSEGDGYAIVDDHPYLVGGPSGSPDYYTITITVTGPGIDPADPLTGTTLQIVNEV